MSRNGNEINRERLAIGMKATEEIRERGKERDKGCPAESGMKKGK